MHKKNKDYTIHYEKSGILFYKDAWKRFKQGFLTLNYMVKPQDLIDFKVCNLGEKTISFYDLENKKVSSLIQDRSLL
jgi:hypothetical protein